MHMKSRTRKKTILPIFWWIDPPGPGLIPGLFFSGDFDMTLGHMNRSRCSSLTGLLLLLVSSVGWTHDEHAHEAQARLDDRTLDSVERLVTSAEIAQTRHKFDRALSDLEHALALDPHHDRAWLIAASIHLVQGDVNAAQAACRKLRRVPAVAVITYSARVSIARGESLRVLRPLETLLRVIDLESTDAGWSAWAYGVAGDFARRLDTCPGNGPLLSRRRRAARARSPAGRDQPDDSAGTGRPAPGTSGRA